MFGFFASVLTDEYDRLININIMSASLEYGTYAINTKKEDDVIYVE